MVFKRHSVETLEVRSNVRDQCGVKGSWMAPARTVAEPPPYMRPLMREALWGCGVENQPKIGLQLSKCYTSERQL